MDDLIKELILNNRLFLTLAAMVFTPLGLYTVVRWFQRDDTAERVRASEEDRRLRGIEESIGALLREMAQLQLQQARLAGLLEQQSRLPSTPSNHAPLSRSTPPA